jgi:lon-related putative ATP-dependent protease
MAPVKPRLAVPRPPRPRRGVELAPEELRRRVDPASLGFSTTAEVEPLSGTIGQPRALEAIEYGLEVETAGFNLFLAGAPGSGRLSTVLDYLHAFSRERPRPDDWVYVHDFADPGRPTSIHLPAGRGGRLARDMQAFVAAARREIPRAFESEDYARRQREIVVAIGRRRDELAEDLRDFARAHGSALDITPAGVVTVPLRDGRPLTKEQFEVLPAEERERVTEASREIQARTAAFLHQLHQLEKETGDRVRELERDVALFATGRLFLELRERYAGEAKVLAYLDAVRDDVLGHVDDFGAEAEERPTLPGASPADRLSRYAVNVFVDNAETAGAPVVLERNPSYYNLIGRVEYRPAFGAAVTDFREIKPGALHRANGGFLVLEVEELVRHPFAWQALKRALRTREVRIENLAEELSPVPSATLRPEPVPLDVKVVLIGSPHVHHLLYALDEDFPELFKVKAEFAPDMPWSRRNERSYAAFVSRWVRESGLRHFDARAVARLIEHGARLRESQRRLSTRLIEISDLVSEASFCAGKAGHDVVQAADVEEAVARRDRRSDLVEERTRELIDERTLVIHTAGRRVGELNGLSVARVGDHAFGRPTRVTARVSAGRAGVASIEREVDLSGPIHSKGVLILSGYLAGTYGRDFPPALSATLTFEQSYDEVEGDSASSTELYVLLSALSGLPLDQGIAVTGSVNQHGEIQAVGGVTHKIEGFFATCRARGRGLTGTQGVIIPRSNVRDLMLADEVVEAVREGRFHVWAVGHVDEGLELLTGRRAGRRGSRGAYPPDSVHGLVEARLREFAERLRAFAEPPDARTNGRGPRGRA